MHSDTIYFIQNVKWNRAVENLNGVKPNERVGGWRLNEKKQSVDKCSEVEWSVVGLSVVKWSEVYMGEVQMGRSEVSTSVVKWSEV
jgi:hypothetical protein